MLDCQVYGMFLAGVLLSAHIRFSKKCPSCVIVLLARGSVDRGGWILRLTFHVVANGHLDFWIWTPGLLCGI